MAMTKCTKWLMIDGRDGPAKRDGCYLCAGMLLLAHLNVVTLDSC